jgi:hypothetical protein
MRLSKSVSYLKFVLDEQVWSEKMPTDFPRMGGGRRPRKAIAKKGKGIAAGWRLRKIDELQAAWDAFEMSDNKTKECLTDISSKAARGFQAPQTDYGLWDWLPELYALLVDMPKEERTVVIDELSTFYRKRKGASAYGALVRAACARWYDNPKRISWAAVRLEAAIKQKVPLKKFATFCEKYGN